MRIMCGILLGELESRKREGVGLTKEGQIGYNAHYDEGNWIGELKDRFVRMVF